MHDHPRDIDGEDIEETSCDCCHRFGYDDEIRTFDNPAKPGREKLSICDECAENHLDNETIDAVEAFHDSDEVNPSPELYAALKAITKPWPTAGEQLATELRTLVQTHGIQTVTESLNTVLAEIDAKR